ncbi:thiamine diphosphokinase [Bacillus sp. Bva_UNVM-123]|uniref:thiamine diphosphokinase n=1 Tax=Bacillus sp. Bva_UNVM-123 TaxID=2829798 RepID=UPI00391FB646
MNINILGGGPIQLLPLLTKYETEQDRWIGVDKGVITLFSLGIKPISAFGDFDSVTVSELANIKEIVGELHQYRPEKDETDMELAVSWAKEQRPNKIRIFGATGGRLDHFFANIQLLIKPILDGNHVPIEIIDQKNIVFLKAPGSYPIKKSLEKKYISFIPISAEIHDLSLEGFKYPLKNRHILLGSTLCISNELINDYGNFSFSTGILMVVRSND